MNVLKKFFQKNYLPLALTLFITFIITSIQLLPLLDRSFEQNPVVYFFRSIEQILQDSKLRQRGPLNVNDNIVIAAIDEKSVKDIGRWPWSRKEIAKLIDKLKEHNAKIIGLDIVFSEEDKNLAYKISDQIIDEYKKSNVKNTNFEKFLFQTKKQANTDWMMGESISKFSNNIVLGYLWLSQTNELTQSKEINEKIIQSLEQSKLLVSGVNTQKKHDYNYPRADSALINIPQITKNAKFFGFLNSEADLDSVYRRAFTVMGQDEDIYPSFALQIYALYNKAESIIVNTTLRENIKLINQINLIYKNSQETIHTDYSGKIRLNYKGPEQTFAHYSISDILNNKETIRVEKFSAKEKKYKIKKISKDKAFKDKIVLVGATAPLLKDIRAMPFNKKSYPGVEIHANMINNLIEKDYLVRSDEMILQQIISMFILAFLFTILLNYLNFFLSTASTLILLSTVIFIDYQYFYLNLHLINDIFFVIIQIIIIFIIMTSYKYFTEGKNKQFLIQTFKSYISPELIDQMYEKKHPPKLGGNLEILSAFFTDIQGFSSFSEKLDVTQLVDIMNEYLTKMTDILMSQGGTLDKYEGDAIIAFFGAPLPLKDHAIRACITALKMQDGLSQLRKKWQQDDKWIKEIKTMQMRIGINSGNIITGNMGSTQRMNYTMMGSAVNIAARLESSAKQYGIFIHIAQDTVDLIGDNFEIRMIDKVRLVGLDNPVKTYELMAIKGKLSLDLNNLKKDYDQGIKLYYEKNWHEALQYFEKSLPLEEKKPAHLLSKNNPSLIFINRCKKLIKDPPNSEWDGSETLLEK